MHHMSRRKLKRTHSYLAGGVVVGVTAIVGTIIILSSQAAPFTASIEPEDNPLTGGATLVSDGSASNSAAIKFGAAAVAALSQIPNPAIPTVETQVFASSGDIADDSVIYADPTTPANSVVLADNKDNAGGIGVFNMQGKMMQYRPDGKIGNVDLRTGFPFGGRSIVLVGANNRTNNTLIFWEYTPSSRSVTAPISGSIPTVTANYGFCMYKSPVSGKYYAFVISESGSATLEQYELSESAGKVVGTKVRTFTVGSVAEGCVADDANKRLYVAQEDAGLWRYGAEPGDGSTRTQLGKVGDGNLVADVEGVAVAYGPNGTGYIVVSSQGNSRYAIYDRQTNAFMRTFNIGANGSIDAVSDTDGLDISTSNLGPGFEKGALVVHDGSNTGSATSNLKYIPLQ